MSKIVPSESNSKMPIEPVFIPLSEPLLGGNEWEYVKDCLNTAWLSSSGAYVDRFETDMAVFTSRRFAVAAVSGTAALHLALMAVGVQADEEVLVSSLAFVAPANAIRYMGACPVFVDAEPDYWQMDPQKAIEFCENECYWKNGKLRNKSTGRRVSAIIVVHILGHPVDIDPLLNLARKYDLIILEDASQGLGSLYRDRPVGQLGDIGCFSFNGNKIITAGGGGMVVTDNALWAERAKYLSTQAKENGSEYIHPEIGFNYRLTNIHAAIGCAQLERLAQFIQVKRNIASRYSAAFSELPSIRCVTEASWAYSIYWLYTVLIDEQVCSVDSREIMRELKRNGIESRPFWQPLHLSQAHAGSPSTDCSVAEKLYRDGLCLPSSVGLSDDQERVIESFIGILSYSGNG